MKNKYRVCQEILENIMKSNNKLAIKARDMGLKRWIASSVAQKLLFNNNIEMYNTFSYCYFKR